MAPERSKLHDMILPPSLTSYNSWPVKEKRTGDLEPTVETRYSSGGVGRGSDTESERRTKGFEKATSPAVRLGDSGCRSVAGDVGDGGISAEREKIISDIKSAADEMQLAFIKACSYEFRPKPPVQLDAGSSQGKRLKVDEKKESKSINAEKRGTKRFSISLSRSDIDEDFMAIVRRRPPSRPKKRSNIVQKYLNDLYPGLGLNQVTAGKYKVSGPCNF